MPCLYTHTNDYMPHLYLTVVNNNNDTQVRTLTYFGNIEVNESTKTQFSTRSTRISKSMVGCE